MRLFIFFVGVLILLIIGGGLTAQLAGSENSDSQLLPVIIQTNNPEGSVFEATPPQAQAFVLLVGFILFNMLGMGITIALVMWFLHRGLVRSRAGAATEVQAATPEAS